MIGLSKTTGYAMRALVCIADPVCSCSQISRIASCSKVPQSYLAKILRQLNEAGLVQAKRGKKGGIWLALPPDEINLLIICEAIEGPDFIADCLLGADFCEVGCDCPTRTFWQNTRASIRKELQSISLADIAGGKTRGIPVGAPAEGECRVS